MIIEANQNHKDASVAEKQEATRQKYLPCMCRRLREKGMR